MSRRPILTALLVAAGAQLSSGCLCCRPVFPRLRALLTCAPDGAPLVSAPAALPVGPGPALAPAFAGSGVPAGCTNCGPPAGPQFGGYAPVGYSGGFPADAGLPPGAVPVGGPVQGPVMLEPHAGLPTKPGAVPFLPGTPVTGAGYTPPYTGPSTLLPLPAGATPMPGK